MPVTLKKIASELNVSTSLVSQVLNGKARQSRIKKETELLVVKKAKELGYVSNKIARGLRTKKTDTIALLTPNLADPFFARITKVVHNELHHYGYNLMILESNDETSKEIEEMKLVRANGMDGMLIIPVGDEYLHIEELAKKDYPLVLLYRSIENIEVNTITVDHYYNIYKMVSFLVKKGHTRIGLLQGVSLRYANRERLRGYKTALKENNIEFANEYVVKIGFEREHGYNGTKKLLELPTPPTAIILNGDFQTFGSLSAIKEKGLQIPDDITLVSTNILNIEEYIFVPIFGIHHPIEEMAKSAVSILIDSIENSKKNQRKKIVVKSKFNINEENFFLVNKKNHAV